MKPTQRLFVVLLLSGCSSGSTDPRIDQAPMRADTKNQARAYFNQPNPKAFAFSPEKGTNWAVWGASSVEGAKESAMQECERRTRTPCMLFAVNDEIVWQPSSGRPTVGALEDKPGATTVAPEPVAKAQEAAASVNAPVVEPEVSPTPARIAIHVASVRDAADVSGEWGRLAKRYQVLSGLEPQAPTVIEVPGKGTFYRILGGAFTTTAEAQTVCERVRSAGGYCAIVVK
jgi:hypothetical protein